MSISSLFMLGRSVFSHFFWSTRRSIFTSLNIRFSYLLNRPRNYGSSFGITSILVNFGYSDMHYYVRVLYLKFSMHCWFDLIKVVLPNLFELMWIISVVYCNLSIPLTTTRWVIYIFSVQKQNKKYYMKLFLKALPCFPIHWTMYM